MSSFDDEFRLILTVRWRRVGSLLTLMCDLVLLLFLLGSVLTSVTCLRTTVNLPDDTIAVKAVV